jgi:hypothetical protein
MTGFGADPPLVSWPLNAKSCSLTGINRASGRQPDGMASPESAQPALVGTICQWSSAARKGSETMKFSMLRWIGLGLLLAAGLGSTAPAARADDRNSEDNNGLSVTVAFGSGLNTLPPPPQLSGPPNHHILPPEIKIHQGGVVHFMVSGFHQVVVYDPGTTPEDIVVPSSGTFINDLTNVFYLGIPPQGGPPPGTPPTTNPFNGSNRQESVSFSDRGTYLVICNVRTHFLDGMFAFVKVVGPDDDVDDHHSHH